MNSKEKMILRSFGFAAQQVLRKISGEFYTQTDRNHHFLDTVRPLLVEMKQILPIYQFNQ